MYLSHRDNKIVMGCHGLLIHTQELKTFENVVRKQVIQNSKCNEVLISRMVKISCPYKGMQGEFMVAPLLKSLYTS